MSAPLPGDEAERLQALHRFAVLDTPPEPEFDDLTALAAQICGTPIAAIALVDAERQWFKSKVGLEVEETARNQAFCAHALDGPDLLIVPDAALDPRFAAYPNVTGEPHIRFYAGAPLRTQDGHSLGTLCVIDRVPRQLSAAQEQALRLLSRHVMIQLQLRQQTRELARSQTALLGILEDQRRAEQSVRTSEERFRLLAQATNDAIWDWNLLTGGRWWNENFFAIFGHLRETVETHVSSWENHLHPEDRERVVARIRAVIDRGGQTWSDEYRFLRRDGSVAFVSDRGCVIRDDAGQAVRMVGGMSDHTERRRLEQQALRAQRMEGIGTLAGGIAHDLNNVLGPIMLSTDLLKMSCPAAADRELLAIIDSRAHHGADLVRQVLSFARGVEGERAEVSIRNIVRDIETLANETFLKHIEIRTAIPHDLWAVLGDRTQLHQVLLNLCINARDAMPRGGTLTLAAENRTLDAHYAGLNPEARPGPHVLLQVADSGTGMPPDVIERIFDPFFTTKPFGQGTGLGLSTALGIVKSHGGFLQVASEPGKGTKFSVYLPAQLESAPPAAVTVLGEPPRGAGELILVVDDEPAVRVITQHTLEAFGYRVVLASDGAEAVAIYAKQKDGIAAVLTDMMMPVMDGGATIQVLRKMNPDLPVIAASGVSTTDPATKAAALGVKHFLPKPYTAATLLQALHAALKGQPAGPAVGWAV